MERAGHPGMRRLAPALAVAAWVAGAEAEDKWTWLEPQPQSFRLSSVVFRDSARGFACGSGGALYTTQDGGDTWSRLPVPSFRSLNALAFLGPQVGLAIGSGGALLRSADGGASWNAVPSGTTRQLTDVDGTGSIAFAVVGDGGLLKSTDAGSHWKAVGQAANASFSEIHLRGADTLSALGRSASPDGDTILFLKSVDGGSSWSRKVLVPEGTIPNVFQISRLHFPSGDTGFAQGTQAVFVGHGVDYREVLLKTEDGGAHWASRTLPEASFPFGTPLLFFRDARRGVALASTSSYATEDGGATWVPGGTFPDFGNQGFGSVRGFGANSYLAVGENVALKSQDGGKTWRTVLKSPNGRLYKDIYFPDAATGYALTDAYGGPGLVATRDGGTHWAPVPASVDGPGFPSPDLSSLRFSGALDGVASGEDNGGDRLGLIYHTADAGAHWTLAQQVPGRGIHDMRFSSGAIGIAVGDSGLVMKTADGGRHWSLGSSGTNHRLVSLDFPSPSIGYALGIGWSETQPDPTLFLNETVVLRTEDGGGTWKRQAAFTAIDGLSIRFVDTRTGFMTANKAIGIASAIMKTRDGGASWKQVAEFEGYAVNRIEFQDSLNLFALGSGEVFRSRDGGETWSAEAIPAGQAYALHFPSRDAGFLACDGAILKVVPSAAISIRPARDRPAEFLLGSDLRYRLDAPSPITALLFDFRGRRVATLFQGQAGPGSHQLPWPAGMAQGPFLLDFRAGGFRQQLRLIR